MDVSIILKRKFKVQNLLEGILVLLEGEGERSTSAHATKI
jgi:hypothetical protein